MNTSTMTKVQRDRRNRLIGLAVWAAGEKAKEDLGLPSQWNQSTWLGSQPCGTVCCLGGKVALDDGGVPVAFDEDGHDILDPVETRRIWESARFFGEDGARVIFPGTRDVVFVDGYAASALGLTENEAEELFNADNDLEDVIDVIRRLINADA